MMRAHVPQSIDNTQRKETRKGASLTPPPIQRKENKTGMPDQLKSGIEKLSGVDVSDVKVHYNSSQPAQLNAHAYAQGNQIHIAPGQEKHLPHEAWHVVQQKQGRVKSTTQLRGKKINDDKTLEKEADVMGHLTISNDSEHSQPNQLKSNPNHLPVVQRRMGVEYETAIEARMPGTAPPWTFAGWVPQDQLMYNAGTWQIVSDNSKLEFVVDPPAANAAALAPIMHIMMNNIMSMSHTIMNGDSNLHTALPVTVGAPNYELKKYQKKTITGSLQGTIGVPFSKLYRFFDLLTTYKLEASKELLKNHEQQINRETIRNRLMHEGPEKTNHAAQVVAGTAALANEKAAGATAISPGHIATFNTIKNSVDALCAHLPARAAAMQAPFQAAENDRIEKLKGLLHFVGQYEIFALNYRSSYKKKSFPVMSRSSFRSMYLALGNNFYKREFRRLVISLTQQLGIKPEDQMFKNTEVAIGTDGTFTVRQWLDSIENGEIRFLPDGSSMKSDKMTGPDTATHDTDKSMGSMRLDQQKVVVELRSIKHLAELATHTPYMATKFVNDLARLDL